MKKQFLKLGKALNKANQRKINGGFTGSCTPQQCAEDYNLTAFDPLPDSSFRCEGGRCILI